MTLQQFYTLITDAMQHIGDPTQIAVVFDPGYTDGLLVPMGSLALTGTTLRINVIEQRYTRQSST